jgi:hypothetical protein
VTKRGIIFLGRLRKLEKFEFELEDLSAFENRNCEIYPLIMMQMPYLRLVGAEWYTCTIFTEEEVFSATVPVDLAIRGTFMQEELLASSTLPQRATFPNLRSLFFWGPLRTRRSIDILALSTKLTHLAMTSTPFRQVANILDAVGATLTSLYFQNVPDKIDVVEIFFHCPNLSNLDISNSKSGTLDFHTEFWPQISSHNFRLLQRCSVKFEGFAPPGLIKCLIEAPLIEKLELWNVTLRPSDCHAFQDVLDLIHLKHLKIWILNQDTSIMFDIIRMVKHLLCIVPELLQGDDLEFHEEELADLFESRKDIPFFFELNKNL